MNSGFVGTNRKETIEWMTSIDEIDLLKSLGVNGLAYIDGYWEERNAQMSQQRIDEVRIIPGKRAMWCVSCDSYQ
jgi:hypothetical protein